MKRAMGQKRMGPYQINPAQSSRNIKWKQAYIELSAALPKHNR